jgi:DNA polymerase I
MSTQKRDTLILIDSFALIHRAYHAYPPTLTTKDGQLVNAVFGFAKLMLDVLKKFQPEHVVAVFDSPGATFRDEMYHAYKANRGPSDDDFNSQIPLIVELLKAFDIPVVSLSGYEADDVIGTLDNLYGDENSVIVVTGDRDLLQLVDENTRVYLAGGSFVDSKLFDIPAVEAKMGVKPDLIPDLKGIQGDASDNIPGVPGIGPKGAIQLLNDFGSVEGVIENLDKLKGAMQTKFSANTELALLSKKLATIACDAPIDFDFKDAKYPTFDVKELQKYLTGMQFFSLLKYVPSNEDLTNIAATVSEAKGNNTVSPWNGKSLNVDEVFVHTRYEGDHNLNLKVSALEFMAGSDIYSVNTEMLPKFVEAIQGVQVISWDLKSLHHALRNAEMPDGFKDYDVQIAYVLAGAGVFKGDLPSVLERYTATELTASVVKQIYEDIQPELDAETSRALALEMRLLPVVVSMERRGISIDVSKLSEFKSQLQDLIEKLVAKVYHEVGHEFNIGSPKQVGQVLFEERGLPAPKKTKTGGYSTDERTLRDFMGADPVVEMILSYRELTKLLSTYVDSLPTYVYGPTNKIHSRMDQMGAVTGRFASKDPNLQNLPAEPIQGVDLRAGFVASPGKIFVSFDYSQQELRLLAEFSGEENMRKAFTSGEDIHLRTASRVLGIPMDKLTREQRKIGKTINFGIVYGMSAFGMADRLKIPPKQAAEFIEKYFAEFSGVKKYFETTINDARKSGLIRTFLGRKKNTAGLNAPNFQLRAALEREVINYPLQGGAAEVIKMAMVQMAPIEKQFDAAMILQIHDELLFEYPADSISDVQNSDKFIDFVSKVRQTMLSVVNMKVPFEVGVSIGTDLANLTDFEYAK